MNTCRAISTGLGPKRKMKKNLETLPVLVAVQLKTIQTYKIYLEAVKCRHSIEATAEATQRKQAENASGNGTWGMCYKRE
jgi:hypothetical protein